MPRFYLHIRDGNELIEDDNGVDLPDENAAREEALASAREILADLIRAGKLLDGQQFEIVNEVGQMIAMIPFKAVLKLD